MEYAWGEVWNKESLNDKERSMINLGMIAALNRPHELKLHIKGALNNGLTKDQIRDIFLQVTVYCGAPAGIDSMRLAREVLDSGGSAPTILNASNEVAVHGFLQGKIGFLDIAAIAEQTLERVAHAIIKGFDDVLQIDAEARRVADELIGRKVGKSFLV